MFAPGFPRPLPDELIELISARLALLSDATRIRVIDELREGERSVQAIADALPTTQQNVSGHLRRLRTAGVVSRHPLGRTVYYAISDATIFHVWERSVAGLRRGDVARVIEDVAADQELPHQGGSQMRVVTTDQLHPTNIAREFVGEDHGTSITILLVDAEPGSGPALHRHPYDEVFIVQEGEATFRTAREQRVVRAGEIVVVSAGEPHAFTNTGTSRLKQIDIHPSPSFSTEWLDAEGPSGDAA